MNSYFRQIKCVFFFKEIDKIEIFSNLKKLIHIIWSEKTNLYLKKKSYCRDELEKVDYVGKELIITPVPNYTQAYSTPAEDIEVLLIYGTQVHRCLISNLDCSCSLPSTILLVQNVKFGTLKLNNVVRVLCA